jgi:hypothetical protein
VNSREEALAWTKRFPNPAGAGKNAEIEVRQLFGPEDFGESQAIERFREMGAGRRSGSPRPGGRVRGRRARPAALHR